MRLLPIIGWFAVGVGTLALTGLIEAGWNLHLSAPLAVLRTFYQQLADPVPAPFIALSAAVAGLATLPPWWADGLAMWTSLGVSALIVAEWGQRPERPTILAASMLAFPTIGLVQMANRPDDPGFAAICFVGITCGVAVSRLTASRSATAERKPRRLMAFAPFAIPIASAILLLVDALLRAAGF